MARRRRAWVPRVGWALVGIALLALGGWVLARASAAHTAEDFQRWTNWANIFALLVGVVGTAMLAFDKSKGAKVLPEAPNSQQIGQVVEDLSDRLERNWAEEAVLREVTRPRPVRVRWSPTGQRSASRELVFGVP